MMILLNKRNGSSTERTYKLAVQWTIEVLRSAVCHDGSSSKRILQFEYISMEAWQQHGNAYHYGLERIRWNSSLEQVRSSTLKGGEAWALFWRMAKETAAAVDDILA